MNPAPPIESLMTRACIDKLREAISLNGGAEVFFIGRLSDAGIVRSVVPRSYGNRGAVAAPYSGCEPGDVMIHNHPSGVLEPSTGDVSVAAQAGDIWVGNYIVNNDCTAVRVVVEPTPRPWLDAHNIVGEMKTHQSFSVGELHRASGLTEVEAEELYQMVDRGEWQGLIDFAQARLSSPPKPGRGRNRAPVLSGTKGAAARA